MKSRILLLMAFLSFTSFIHSQVNTVFDLFNNNTSVQLYPETILKGANNDVYLIASDSYMTHFILRIDANNQVIWAKEIDDIDDFMTISEVKIFNNHIYLLGTTPAPNYILTKIDMNGNLIWTKQLSPSSASGSYHLPSLEIHSNQVVVSSSMFDRIDLYSLKEDGSENWIRSFNTDSGSGKNPNFDITLTENGDIMGCAKAGSNMSIYCISGNNQLKWSKTYLEQQMDYTHIKSILEINSNRYLLCGYRIDDMMNIKGFYSIIDSTGSFIDYRMINETSEIKNGTLLNNGNILLEAIEASDTTWGDKKILIQISTDGNIVQSVKFSDGNPNLFSYNCIAEQNGYQYLIHNLYLQKLIDYNSFSCITYLPINLTYQGLDPNVMPTSSYMVTYPGASVQNNSMLSISDANVSLGVVCQSMAGIEDQETHSIHLYPTILHNTEMININHDLSGSIEYHICDMTGKMVMQNQLTGNTIQINGLSAGMYVIRLVANGNMIYSDKFVVTE